MTDTLTSIPTQRRTLANAMDETCQKLTECPPIPPEAVRKTLTNGSIAELWQDDILSRWRMDNTGAVTEYYHFKARPPQCPWDAVWWRE